MDNLLRVSEVAQLLRVDATTVRRWIAQGLLESVTLPHIGKRRVYRVKREVVEQFLEPQTTLHHS